MSLLFRKSNETRFWSYPECLAFYNSKISYLLIAYLDISPLFYKYFMTEL